MKLETRLQLTYFTLLVFTFTAIILRYSLHQRWYGDLAGILLGVCLQAIIIPLAWLALKNQGRLVTGRRLFWARLLLVLIIVLYIGGIAAFQVNRAMAAFAHFAKQTR